VGVQAPFVIAGGCHPGVKPTTLWGEHEVTASFGAPSAPVSIWKVAESWSASFGEPASGEPKVLPELELHEKTTRGAAARARTGSRKCIAL
jgi:hypothetical protein